MSKSAGSKERNDERLFFYVVTVMSLFFGTGFCALLYALNYRDQAQESIYENLPDTQPAVIRPAHPRQLTDAILQAARGRINQSDASAGNMKFLMAD